MSPSLALCVSRDTGERDDKIKPPCPPQTQSKAERHGENRKLFEEKKSAEIAAEMNLSPNTVENIRKALIAKTGSENVVGLIKYGWRMGIIW